MVTCAKPAPGGTLPLYLDTATLSPRLQGMIAVLLAHGGLLEETALGCLELHYCREGHQERIKPILRLNL